MASCQVSIAIEKSMPVGNENVSYSLPQKPCSLMCVFTQMIVPSIVESC